MSARGRGSSRRGSLRGEDAARLRRLARKYDVRQEIGRGGMAVVYHAHDRALGRDVAIKVIHAQHAADPETVSRMEREARTVARLDHSHIVTLYESRRLEDRSLALVMQYVPGGTLREALRRESPLPFARAGQVLRDIAGALAYAHGRHVVHRDVKPGNIYLDAETGAALLADFGIARWTDAEGLTLDGTALGTPTYMSPEQIDGRPVDGRSDLYSLGLVGYEMLTGRRPWEGETLYHTIYNHKHGEIPPLEELRPGTPPRLAAAIEGALRKEPDQRWESAEEMLAQLTGTAPVRVLPRPAPPPVPAVAEPDDPTIRYRPGVDGAPPVPARAPLPATVEARQPAAPLRHRRTTRVAAAAGAVLVLAATVGAMAGLRDSGEAGGAVAPPTPVRTAVAAPVLPPAANGSSAVPARLAALGAAELEGPVGAPLPEAVAIRVEDAAGAPVPGVEVRFAARGGGTAEPAVAVTDSAGVARATWTLGRAAEEQTLAARAAGVADSLLLRSRAVPAGPARVRAAAGDAQRGVAGGALGDSLAVRVEDAFGNPVAGVRVRFRAAEGSGAVAPEWVRTDSAGRAAAAWTLGERGGRLAAEASAGDGPGLRVRFAARAAEAPEGPGEAEAPAAAGAPAAKVAAGGMHTCALTAAGEAYCWGGNDRGQLGTGETERRSAPGAVAGRLRFGALSGGVLHTCALTRGGAAYCWGANDAGQLGDGSSRPHTGPARVAGGRSFSELGTGSTHTCALGGGSVYCWGANRHGQLGDGSTTPRTSPVRVEGSGFRALAVGWDHACALDGRGRAMCWGANSRGQLGDGGTEDRSTPVAAAAGRRLVELAAGSAHTCALDGDGRAYCWGRNDRGQLGDGSRADRPRPAAVRGGQRFGSITAGGVHTCALAGSGEAWCWGRNDRGQLGDGSTTDRAAPVPVAGGLRFASIQASGAHTCGVTVSGRSYCWGYNVEGQLGDGTRTHRSRPVPVARPQA
jgi:serine/threonine protein kinase/alpha-tubulin suppressor-like RCC1 family protein